MNTFSAERIDAVGSLNLLLTALGADCHEFIAPPGLTAVAIQVPARAAIIALTHATAPIYRAAVADTAMAYAADVVLLRQSDTVSGGVSADVALAAPRCAAWIEHDLTLWTDDDTLWLVPHGFGPSVAIDDTGFCVTLGPPYATLVDRAKGIARAARAFAAPRSPMEVR